jgi:hypothetical protein
MSDTTLKEGHSSEEMFEFENLLNGEIYFIKAAEIKECELKREQLRLMLITGYLSSPSHLARVVEDPEDWGSFADFIIGSG